MYSCQNCTKNLKLSLINMGEVPIANHLLLKKEQLCKSYPLQVFLCKECKLYQLGKRLNPKTIFNNYSFNIFQPKCSISSAYSN